MGVIGESVAFVLLCLLSCTSAAPIDSSILSYLSKYGYLTPPTGHLGQFVDNRTYKRAIEEFQAFMGLDVTGQLDAATMKTMSLQRCGVKDKVMTGHRTKRYSPEGGTWESKDLTYRISKYPQNWNRGTVDKVIQKAFNVWSEQTDLTFTTSRGRVNIDIRFESGEHGDGQPFDGPLGVLGHAYFPTSGGDTHFDADEEWSINKDEGTNLFQVAVHEFGHALGLGHSSVPQAVMAPTYSGYDPDFRLDADDIEGIQELYGGGKHDIGNSNRDEDSVQDEGFSQDGNVGESRGWDQDGVFVLGEDFDQNGGFFMDDDFDQDRGFVVSGDFDLGEDFDKDGSFVIVRNDIWTL